MAQKYQQIEINKEEFKNLVTRKIDNVHEIYGNKLHEIYGNKLQLRSQI